METELVLSDLMVLEKRLDRLDKDRKKVKNPELDRDRMDAMVAAIVGFRIKVRRLDAKFKLSQNRTRDDRARVIAALEAEAHPDADATARWMRAYADPDA